MDKLHLVVGEHWDIPGIRMSIHKTRKGAVENAVKLVRMLAKDSGLRRVVDENNWEDVIGKLQDKHGAAHTHVYITELPLED